MSFIPMTKGRGPSKTPADTVTLRCRYNAHRLEAVFSFGSGIADKIGMRNWGMATILKGADEDANIYRFVAAGEDEHAAFRVKTERDRLSVVIRASRLGYSESFGETELRYRLCRVDDAVGVGVEVSVEGIGPAPVVEEVAEEVAEVEEEAEVDDAEGL